MATRYLDLGNAIVPLTAKLNGNTIDDEILEWIPFTVDINGSLITTSYYKTVESSTLNQNYVLDIGESQFDNDEIYGLVVGNVEYLYDPHEDQFVRKTSNHTIDLISGTYSSTQESSTLKNYNQRGGHFFIEITDIETDATLTPIIQGRDGDTGEPYDILVGTTLTAVGVYVLKVYPGIGQIPNGSASDILPRQFLLRLVYGGTGTITYSSSCSLIM